MQAPIVIIGSGFAAYQLVKTVRRMDAHIQIQVFTADGGAEYNKPDLSHVFSKNKPHRIWWLKRVKSLPKNTISSYLPTR